MENEKVALKTEAGQTIEAVVLSKHADKIEVVIGESGDVRSRRPGTSSRTSETSGAAR